MMEMIGTTTMVLRPSYEMGKFMFPFELESRDVNYCTFSFLVIGAWITWCTNGTGNGTYRFSFLYLVEVEN